MCRNNTSVADESWKELWTMADWRVGGTADKSQTSRVGNGYGLVRYIGERTRMYIIDWSIESRVMHHHRLPVVVDSFMSQDCTKSRSRIKVPEPSTAAVRFRFRSDLGYPILFILVII